MKKIKRKTFQNWIATRMEVGRLLGLKNKSLCRLEKWAGIQSTSTKTKYSPTEFRRLKKRISELRRHVTF